MYINSPLFNDTDDDDLFARPPRSGRRQPPVERTARRQCRACDLTYVVALDDDGPPLCPECRSDPAATRARLLRGIDAIQRRELAALDVWDAVRQPSQAAWDRIEDGRDRPDFAAKCAEHITKGNVYAKLLTAHAAYETTVQALASERDWLERALEAMG